MGADSKIQWTHHTFNGWIGCSKVSPGCKHCYAEAQTYPRISKARGLPLWGDLAHRHITSDSYWRAPLGWDREAAAAGERQRVFAFSLADVFEDRDDLLEPRSRLASLIGATPHLDWLLLTKRPEHAQRLWREACGDTRISTPCVCGSHGRSDLCGEISTATGQWEQNIWLGTTVENQEMADQRIPHLLHVPVRVRFLSCEPLLEPVNLHRWLCAHGSAERPEQRVSGWCSPSRAISWVIVGGESGSKARPCALEWIEDLIAQCRAADVATFVKQLGTFVVSEERAVEDPEEQRELGLSSKWAWRAGLKDSAGGDPAEWPDELNVREFPKVAS